VKSGFGFPILLTRARVDEGKIDPQSGACVGRNACATGSLTLGYKSTEDASLQWLFRAAAQGSHVPIEKLMSPQDRMSAMMTLDVFISLRSLSGATHRSSLLTAQV